MHKSDGFIYLLVLTQQQFTCKGTLSKRRPFRARYRKLEENLKEVHMAACKIAAALLSRFHIISSMIGQILLQGHSVPIQIYVIKIAHILIRKHICFYSKYHMD